MLSAEATIVHQIGVFTHQDEAYEVWLQPEKEGISPLVSRCSFIAGMFPSFDAGNSGTVGCPGIENHSNQCRGVRGMIRRWWNALIDLLWEHQQAEADRMRQAAVRAEILNTTRGEGWPYGE